ncbi:MAG: hypothetical protein ACI8XC_003661, partial [Gammaproteobacteria bacterium]
GVQFPTGGIRGNPSARERFQSSDSEGQQIRCQSEADGDSPDEREWEMREAIWLVPARRPDPFHVTGIE